MPLISVHSFTENSAAAVPQPPSTPSAVSAPNKPSAQLGPALSVLTLPDSVVGTQHLVGRFVVASLSKSPVRVRLQSDRREKVWFQLRNENLSLPPEHQNKVIPLFTGIEHPCPFDLISFCVLW